VFDQGDAILFFCKYQTFLFRCISESWIEVLKAESRIHWYLPNNVFVSKPVRNFFIEYLIQVILRWLVPLYSKTRNNGDSILMNMGKNFRLLFFETIAYFS